MRVLPPPPREALKDATALDLLRVLLAEQLRELLRYDPESGWATIPRTSTASASPRA